MRVTILVLALFCVLIGDDFNIDAIMEEGDKDLTKKEIDLKKFKSDSNKEFKKLKREFYQKYEYVPQSAGNSVKKEIYCFSNYIRDDEGKNFCLAYAKNDKSYCYYSGFSDAWKNICLGYCFDSSLSKAQKAFCLALKNGNQSYCFDSYLKGSLKAMCLGRFNKTNCFSIRGEREKNICLGISQN